MNYPIFIPFLSHFYPIFIPFLSHFYKNFLIKKSLMVFEKYLIFFLFFNCTTWKKYLQEWFWSKKEKAAIAWVQAWKNAGGTNTYKGFYIPIVLPQTDQAKFFQKKWDEDEEWMWDEQIFKKKKFFKKKNYWNIVKIKSTWKISFLKKKLLWSYLKINKLSQNFNNNWNIIWPSHSKILFWTKKKLFSNWIQLKFSKKFITTKAPLFKIYKNQHFWSYLNIGLNTSEFFNFFLIETIPTYLVNFNFLKNKILLAKWFKNLIKFLSKKIVKIIKFYNFNLTINFLVFKKNFITTPTWNNLFFFNKLFKNWIEWFYQFFFFKNLIFSILIEKKKNSLLGNFFFYLINFIKINTFTNKKIRKSIWTFFFSRIFGQIIPITKKNFSWKKKLLKNNFFLLHNNIPNIYKFNFFLTLQKNIFFTKNILLNTHLFYLTEVIFSNFNEFLTQNTICSKSNLLIFLNWFTKFGLHLSNSLFTKTKSISKTFLIFLRNWVKHYQIIKTFLYTSFAHQVQIVEDINVPDILFRYIIWKGKKLTAWTVFLKFLKKFKKKYSLPPLAIFIHAMLMIEPHIWLKKKRIAGKLYEIPIYISSSWSKWIAIRWLLQAAKKWKWASITESLANEVWDACFKRGGAFSNYEHIQTTARWNKAYLWWL